MEIGWILGGIFVLTTIAFMALAVFFPEWVGITGKTARETMKEQQGDKPPSQTDP